MFLGHYEHTIDEKGRITLPAKFRADLTSGLVITRGEDKCLVIYTIAEWQRRTEAIRQLSSAKQDVRNYTRLILSAAEGSTPDKQGRVLLPQRLREYASLNTNVVLIGLDNRIEVWDSELWQEVMTQAEQNSTIISEEIGKLDIKI
jgi:MraZ protein